MKYACAICKNDFDKPKRKVKGTYHLMGIFGAILVLGAIVNGDGGLWAGGVACLLIYGVFIFAGIASKKVCPKCNGENFYKNS